MSTARFSQQLTNRLLKLRAGQWRSLRTEVRWRYQHMDLSAPGVLSDFMRFLPEDAQEWRDYALNVTAQRRADRAVLVRRVARQRDKKAQKMHRAYMADYMRDYRVGKRRRAM